MACDISPVASFFLWSSPRAIKLKSGFLYCQDSSDPLCQSPIIKQTLVQKSENTGSLMTIPECNGMQGCDNDFYRVLCLFMDCECVFTWVLLVCLLSSKSSTFDCFPFWVLSQHNMEVCLYVIFYYFFALLFVWSVNSGRCKKWSLTISVRPTHTPTHPIEYQLTTCLLLTKQQIF